MKAARLYGVRDVRIEDLPTPELRPGLALVRSRAVSICGSDLHYFQDGRIGDSLAAQPLVLGHEFAGEVIAVEPGASRDGSAPHGGLPTPGAGGLPPDGLAATGGGLTTSGLQAGAREVLRPGTVVAIDPAIACEACEHCLAGNPNLCPQIRFAGTPPTDGGLQEYLAWPAHLLHPLPAGMSYETGALLEPLGVAIHAVDLAKIRLADTVAVLGAGPIGLLVIRLAALSGAARVFATDVRADRVEAARAFGAQAAIDVSSADPGPWVRKETSGRGVDVAIECAGSPEAVEQAIDVVRPGGTVVLVGIPSDDRVAFGAAKARRKGATVKFCRRMKHVYARALALVAAGMVDLPPLVSHRFSLDELPAAFAALDRGERGLRKVVIAL
ncbi:MAG: zinc-binding dehydrogenase [Chloroflexota bacterium]|nr:zinc-binding dehydrogenase [Chloroflexota bacterium]